MFYFVINPLADETDNQLRDQFYSINRLLDKPINQKYYIKLKSLFKTIN